MKLEDNWEHSEKKMKPIEVKMSILKKTTLDCNVEYLILERGIISTQVLGLNEGVHEIKSQTKLWKATKCADDAMFNFKIQKLNESNSKKK